MTEHLKRDNHFVPQLYLRRWSEDGKRIYAYRTLVSHEMVPLWKLESIRGLAYRKDLYTLVISGEETDEFERWLEKEFETPAEEALSKVEEDRPLTKQDWERLAFFAAAQNLRTPASYMEFVERMHRTIPDLMKRVMRESVAKAEQAVRKGRKLEPKQTPFAYRLPLRVHSEIEPGQDVGQLRAEITIGRQLWLNSTRHLLTGVARILLQHRWSIMRPHPSTEWFTSDHPLVRLNYYKPGSYDFKGGWGKRRGDILMPLSPSHLMFTEIGKQRPAYIDLSAEKTMEMQKLLAEHAHRWIFARRETRRVSWYRPREVDSEKYKAEEKAWEQWHTEQRAAEAES